MHVSEFLPGRPNEEQFEGKKYLIILGIWIGCQIELDKLEVPTSLEIASGGEIDQFIKRHEEKRKHTGG